MSTNPARNWGVILNMAWVMCIRDQQQPGKFYTKNGSRPGPSDMKQRKVCFDFNSSGKCNYGAKCRYDHPCGICHKFGHGSSVCQRASNGSNTSNVSKDIKREVTSIPQ